MVPGRITDPPCLAQDSTPRAPANEGSLFQLLGVLLVDALGCQPYRDPSAGENHLTPGPVLSPGVHRQWLSRDLAISAHSDLIRRFTLTPKQILGGLPSCCRPASQSELFLCPISFPTPFSGGLLSRALPTNNFLLSFVPDSASWRT